MPGTRLGLLIGNSEYRSDSLRQLVAPLADVERLAAVLRRPEIGGFEVRTLLNATRSDIEPAVQEFFEERQRDDLLLLYFSGHGLKNDRGDLFLAASDTERKHLEATAVSARFVHDRMQDCRAQCQVIVLDCCFSGAFPRGVSVKAGDQVQSGEYFNAAGGGQVVLTACDDLQYAFEGDELKERAVARSAFTEVLVEGLETGSADLDRDGLVRLNELHEYVVREFKDRKLPQRPRKWIFDAFDDIVLARNPNLADLLPSDVRGLLTSERVSDRIAATVKLGPLLASRNERQAKAAQEALEHLTKDDSHRVSEAAKAALSQPPPLEPTSGDNIPVKDGLPPPKKPVADGSSPKMGGQIFISYRREESRWSAGRLYDHLHNHSASNQIFIDVVNLAPGVDFVEAIQESVGSCDVLIAVIGKRWLISSDEEGQRRLDNPEDFVRIEIATALKRDIRVIPVLVEGASMPRSRDLPDDLKGLVRRNAHEISHNRFGADSDRLIRAVEEVLKECREREEQERLEAERRQKQEQERLEAERRQKQEQERLEAERRQKQEQERLEAERRQKQEQERLEAERRQKQEHERLEAERCQKPRLPTVPPPITVDIDHVSFSVFAPGVIRPTQRFLLDLWAHLPTQTDEVTSLTREFARDRRLGIKAQVAVARETVLSVVLDLPLLRIKDPIDTIFWNGIPVYASFIVEVPADVTIGDHAGRVIISASGIPVAKVNFSLPIEPIGMRGEEAPQRLPTTTYQPRSAFASFSSRDREEVLGRVQGMTKVCRDIDVFVDVLSLRSGQDWETQIRQQIPARDVFFLFWSLNAARSKEVEKEWRITLEMRGLDYIDPIPLTDPRVSPPPNELAHLHFNDIYVAYLKLEKSLKKLRKRRCWEFWRPLN